MELRTCASIEDSDQPAHPRSLIRLFAGCSMYSKYPKLLQADIDKQKFFFFFFLIWVLRPFQEYFTYIEPIVHRRWAKTGEPGEKPPDHP